MTQPQPQQEYIITEEELSEIIGFQLFKKPELVRAIRSRPIAAGTPEICNGCSFGDACAMEASDSCKKAMQEQHDAAIRNQTLDEVKRYADTCIWIDDDCCPGKMNDKEESDCDGCSYNDYPNNADICEKIESLRTAQHNGDDAECP